MSRLNVLRKYDEYKTRAKTGKKWHVKKYRGFGRQCRSVTVSNITEEGFDIAFKGRHYYIARNLFTWFIGASKKELTTAVRLVMGHPDDHGEYGVDWGLLDVQLGCNDIERIILRGHA